MPVPAAPVYSIASLTVPLIAVPGVKLQINKNEKITPSKKRTSLMAVITQR
jgi:hypothetical protein